MEDFSVIVRNTNPGLSRACSQAMNYVYYHVFLKVHTQRGIVYASTKLNKRFLIYHFIQCLLSIYLVTGTGWSFSDIPGEEMDMALALVELIDRLMGDADK